MFLKKIHLLLFGNRLIIFHITRHQPFDGLPLAKVFIDDIGSVLGFQVLIKGLVGLYHDHGPLGAGPETSGLDHLGIQLFFGDLVFEGFL